MNKVEKPDEMTLLNLLIFSSKSCPTSPQVFFQLLTMNWKNRQTDKQPNLIYCLSPKSLEKKPKLLLYHVVRSLHIKKLYCSVFEILSDLLRRIIEKKF